MSLWHWTDPPRWFFVVDTDSYAGNFERELCGFVCGRFDEAGEHCGGHFKKLYLKDHPDDPFKRLIGSIVDDPGDDGIHRSPMSLAPTPGWINDGHGEHLKLDEAKTKIRKATLKRTYPAYQSVAICLQRKPTDAELKLLHKRAMMFEKAPPNPKFVRSVPHVTGCRLIEEVTTLNETAVT
jgi:hypothetical protein